MPKYNYWVSKSYDLDKNKCYKQADKLDEALYRASQIEIPIENIIEHPISKTETQADKNKYYDVGEVNQNLNITPNSPPQIVTLRDNNGVNSKLLVLHGTPDGKLIISDDSGGIIPVDKQGFDEWRSKKGYTSMPWISCHNGNVSNTGNMNRLLKGTSQFELSTALLPNGSTHLLIKSK